MENRPSNSASAEYLSPKPVVGGGTASACGVGPAAFTVRLAGTVADFGIIRSETFYIP